jgi:(S)-mandelate dehydrogenase
VRAAAPNATLWMQLYVMSDRAIAERVVRRARTAGFEALVLTVDVPVSGLRERDLRHGFRVPMHLTPGTLCDMARHPAWLLRLARAGMPKFANLLPDDDGAPVSAQAQAALLSRAMDRTLTWDSLTWLRRLWDGPLLIKGLLGAEDARSARCATAPTASWCRTTADASSMRRRPASPPCRPLSMRSAAASPCSWMGACGAAATS